MDSRNSLYNGYPSTTSRDLVGCSKTFKLTTNASRETPAKPSHKFSSAISEKSIAQQRQSIYKNQAISSDASTHRVSYQSTDIRASQGRNKAQAAATLANFNAQFNS